MIKKIFFVCWAASLTGMLSAQNLSDGELVEVAGIKELIKSNPERASQATEELLKGKNKKSVPLVVAVARAYLDEGKLQEAQRYLELARKADAKNAQVYLLEGDLALERKETGQAGQFYEQAIYFDSDCSEAYLKLAKLYKKINPGLAMEKLQYLKTIAPDCLEADWELAELCYAENKFDQAAELYARFAHTSAATEDDLLKYAFALFMNRDFEQSLQEARQGQVRYPGRAAFDRLVMYNNVELHRYDDATDAAEVFFHTSVDAAYSSLDYRYYGDLLKAQGDYAGAVEAYKKALDMNGVQTELWSDLADVYEQQNDYGQAIAAYRTYCELLAPEKKSAETLFRLGRLYYGEGTTADTPHEANRADASADTLTDVRRHALQEADSLFALVASLAPDSYLGNLWRARTHSALDAETTDGLAKPYYEQVVELLSPKEEPRYIPVLTECYSYLGYYYLLKNDYAASREYWNKILDLDPANPTARRALEGIG